MLFHRYVEELEVDSANLELVDELEFEFGFDGHKFFPCNYFNWISTHRL